MPEQASELWRDAVPAAAKKRWLCTGSAADRSPVTQQIDGEGAANASIDHTHKHSVNRINLLQTRKGLIKYSINTQASFTEVDFPQIMS